MIEIRADKSLDQLISDLKSLSTNLTKELGIVAWNTAKKTKSVAAKQITSELAVTQREVKERITTKRRDTESEVTVNKSKRIPLKEFKPRQTRKGVSYRISKTTGRKTAADAFMGPKPGTPAPRLHGHVWKRKGKTRLPIQKLYGPSPWGVLVSGDRIQNVTEETRGELRKQLEKRIRWLRLKNKGVG